MQYKKTIWPAYYCLSFCKIWTLRALKTASMCRLFHHIGMVSRQDPAGPLDVAHSALCQRYPGGSLLPPQGGLRPCWPEAAQHPLERRRRVLQAHWLWPELQRGKPGVFFVLFFFFFSVFGGWLQAQRGLLAVSLSLLPPPGCEVYPDWWLPSPRGRAPEQLGSSRGGGGGGLGLHGGRRPLEFGYCPAGDVLRNQTQRHCSLKGVEGRRTGPFALS